ncbi:MAG: hypothetical protein IJL92_04225 [Thermoguttaceae bacterium]|nr:hypothetical protein [Thermoguttaceae bacterium]
MRLNVVIAKVKGKTRRSEAVCAANMKLRSNGAFYADAFLKAMFNGNILRTCPSRSE